MLEATVANVPPQGGPPSIPYQDCIQIDTSQSWFICGVAFRGSRTMWCSGGWAAIRSAFCPNERAAARHRNRGPAGGRMCLAHMEPEDPGSLRPDSRVHGPLAGQRGA